MIQIHQSSCGVVLLFASTTHPPNKWKSMELSKEHSFATLDACTPHQTITSVSHSSSELADEAPRGPNVGTQGFADFMRSIPSESPAMDPHRPRELVEDRAGAIAPHGPNELSEADVDKLAVGVAATGADGLP